MTEDIARAESFEIGPIRPPSEASSLLIRVTRNCPWNKCKFCKIYKKRKFQTRPMEEIERDIDAVANIRDTLISEGVAGSGMNYGRFRSLVMDKPPEVQECYAHVLGWMANGAKTAFLQDANTMVLSYNKLMHILSYIRERLPEIQRLTTYGRADSLNRITGEQFAALREAGLNRIHSGFETGSDKVLQLACKGYAKADELEAGQKIKKAGIELSIYYMPGLGGRELSEDNAAQTADVINKVNPDFVRIRTFVCLPGSGMMEEQQNGGFTDCTDIGKLQELRLMLASVDGADGMLYSDHSVNLLEGARGNLSKDKAKLIAHIDSVLSLPEHERKRFQLARRMGLVRDAGDLSALGGYYDGIIENAIRENESEADWEALLHSLMKRFI